MTDRLHVWANEPDPEQAGRPRSVGTLERSSDGVYAFTYASEWLGRPHRFPLSWSLPLTDAPYHGAPVHYFFQNLLPEGQARRAVASRLGLSEDNDWSMLVAIGGECAGALSILAPDQPPVEPEEWSYERIAPQTLQQLAERRGIVPLLVGGTATRLSLAGAQDKVPVTVLDGKLHLPLGSAPSTHILKLPNRDFAHLVANEAFVTALARASGLDAVDNELFTETDPPCLLVRRFDRHPSSAAWPVVRLHQEDLCQALALPAGRKYEQEGGPTLAQAASIIRKMSVEPLQDIQALLKWATFNVCAGNADAHGKNLALLYQKGGARLAPLYDLVSTRIYLRLDRRLAMSIGDRRDMDTLLERHWRLEAKKLEMGARIVLRLVRATAESVLAALDSTTAAFQEQYGPQDVLQDLPRNIERRTQAVLRGLD